MAHAVNLDLLNAIMQGMAKKEKIFQNEAQFQFELAWELREVLEKIDCQYKVQLEKYTREGTKDTGEKCKIKKYYTDIVVCHPQEKCVAIELKYKTKELPCDKNDFELTNQAAQDLGRYDYFVDLRRNEQLLDSNDVKGDLEFVKGYAILFTNDKCYWTKSSHKKIMYRAFQLVPTEENEVLIQSGSYRWESNDLKISSVGADRMEEVKIKKNYIGKWEEYPVCQSCAGSCKNKRFEYLILECNK